MDNHPLITVIGRITVKINSNRLSQDKSIGYRTCSIHTSVGAPSDNPCSSSVGRFNEALVEDSLQLRLQVKVRDASVDGDKELG